MLKPMLSIVIPVYNTRKYFEECLNSILSNESDKFELIIVDDGSTDGVSEICDKYENNPQIQILHQKNMGVSKARNAGIDLSRGEYITFVDSDDYVASNYIDTILKALQTPKDIYFFGGINLENGQLCRNREWIYKYEELVNREIIFHSVLSGQSNEPWDKVFRRDIVFQYKIRFDEKISLGEDIVFTLEYLKYAKSAQLIKNDIYYYRILNSGLSRKLPQINILEDRNLLFLQIFNFIDCMNLDKNLIDDSYKFMLQIIVNCCGRLFRNNYSNIEIEHKLKEFSWNSKLGDYKYTDIKSCIRKILWKYKKYKLMGLLFNGE